MLKIRSRLKREESDAETQTKKILPALCKKITAKLFKRKCLYLLIVGAIALIGVKTASQALTVTAVHCRFEDTPCPEDLQQKADSLVGVKIIGIQTETFEKEIIRNNPTIARVTVKVRLPSRLDITYRLRRPAALLSISNGTRYFIDIEGMVFETAAETDISNLVVISTSESLAAGEITVSPSIVKSLEIMTGMLDSGMMMENIEIESLQSIRVSLKGGFIVFVNASKEISPQIDTVKFILANEKKFSEKAIQAIDVRFDDPVVR